MSSSKIQLHLHYIYFFLGNRIIYCLRNLSVTQGDGFPFRLNKPENMKNLIIIKIDSNYILQEEFILLRKYEGCSILDEHKLLHLLNSVGFYKTNIGLSAINFPSVSPEISEIFF